MLGEDAARDGIGDCMAEILVVFYVDDGLIASRDPVWLQESFNILVRLFERIGLFTNAVKTKVMVCIPGRIREGYTEEGYADYKSQTVTAADKKRCRDMITTQQQEPIMRIFIQELIKITNEEYDDRVGDDLSIA